MDFTHKRPSRVSKHAISNTKSKPLNLEMNQRTNRNAFDRKSKSRLSSVENKSRQTSRGRQSRFDITDGRSNSPNKYPQTSLKLALMPKDPDSMKTKLRSRSIRVSSGIKRGSTDIKSRSSIFGGPHESARKIGGSFKGKSTDLSRSSINGKRNSSEPFRRERISFRSNAVLQPLNEGVQKAENDDTKRPGIGKKRNSSLIPDLGRKSLLTDPINTRRKSVAAQKLDKDRLEALEELRIATMKNMVQLDDDSLDMNSEGVSFSLSQRLKRRQTIINPDVTEVATDISNLENEGHRRKFRNMSKLLNVISILQEPTDPAIESTVTETQSVTAGADTLSKNINEGTQTTFTTVNSANVIDETVAKKQQKAITSIGTFKKSPSKIESNNHKAAPRGTNIGMNKLMRSPFSFPTKNEILFGPYEDSLFEIQESLEILHLFENLDYYYMPTDPIRKSILEPCKLTYAMEAVYNEHHIPIEILTILPNIRNS